ncbi:unnamed protein product, partial [Acanthocheilonema viteae]
YIINCGRYLPLEVYLPFICGIYGADYHLSEWSNAQLRNVMALLQQPPEMLLQGLLPSDISINEVKQVRPPGIQRAITAIREEKLKRCNKVLTPFVRRIFNSASPIDFSAAVGEFRKLVDDVRIITDNIIKSIPLRDKDSENMLFFIVLAFTSDSDKIDSGNAYTELSA